jgi:protein phosphatase
MVDAFGITDTGCVRSNNEDYYLVAPSLGLYVVADGMGGARAGEHASRLATETVKEYVENTGTADPEVLTRAFEAANRSVLAAAGESEKLEGMGTTLVAALSSGDQLALASVGDSRAYVFHEGELEPVTVDQTWVQEVGRRLGIDEANLKTHPMRHVLTMAIGVTDTLRIHNYTVVLHPGDQLLMCSDGLHGVIEQEMITGILGSSGTLDERCQALVGAARAKGGPDNITAILLQAR